MRLKILAGAPLREELDLSEDNLLNMEACRRLSSTSSAASSKTLKWRRITSKSTHLHPGWLQTSTHDLSLSHGPFDISPTQAGSHADVNVTFDTPSSTADDYVEHSLLFHDTLLSSQVLADEDASISCSSSSFLTRSFNISVSNASISREINQPPSHLLPVLLSTIVTASLDSLPTAQQLHSHRPRTFTPNLLCALIAVPERRQVLVRKGGGYPMDLWEIMVADDTRSGFMVSIWLRPSQDTARVQSKHQLILLETLQRVRPGDVLLLRNIALTSYRNTVHGQSLNGTIARARTSIDVLMKSNGVMVQQIDALPAAMAETFKRVSQWAKSHIATHHVGRKRKVGSMEGDLYAEKSFTDSTTDVNLPPDTMEAI